METILENTEPNHKELLCIGLRIYNEGRKELFLYKSNGSSTWSIPCLFVKQKQIKSINTFRYLDILLKNMETTLISAINIYRGNGIGLFKGDVEQTKYELLIYEAKIEPEVNPSTFIKNNKAIQECMWIPHSEFRSMSNLNIPTDFLKRLMKEKPDIA